MLPLLIDNDFNEFIVRGLIARAPDVDLVRVRDVGMRDAQDPDVLSWAAGHQRVVVTHDIQTMVGHAYDRISRGLPMPGMIAVRQRLHIGNAVEDLLLVVHVYEPEEIVDSVVFLPL